MFAWRCSRIAGNLEPFTPTIPNASTCNPLFRGKTKIALMCTHLAATPEVKEG